jgi:hypothetical protein
MVYDEWSKVFKLAVKKAKEIRVEAEKKGKKIGVAQSMSQAWKDSEVIKAKAEYHKLKEGGRVVSKRRTPRYK